MKKIARNLAFVGVMFVCLLTLCSPAVAEAEKEAKDIVVERMRDIRADNPDFRIQLRTLDGKRRFRVGDEVEFRFRANKDAYVTLVDVGTSGKVSVIFPNKWHKDNAVKANKWYRIPPRQADYMFAVKGPKGVNHIKAIATLDKFDFWPEDFLSKGEGPFDELKDPEKAIKDIGIRLKKRDKEGWTETEGEFIVVNRRGSGGWDDDEGVRSSGRHRDKFVAKLWTDRKTYKIGEPVTFYFYSDEDCYLNLVSFGTSGKIRVIFPNRHQRENFVRGGTEVQIPSKKERDYQFVVDGPGGTEVVKAVVTRHKYQLYPHSYDWEKYVYAPWNQKGDVIEKDIQIRLGEMPDDYYLRQTTKFKVVER